MGVNIEQLLPQDIYDGLEASSSSPSQSNAFATIADITGAGLTDLPPVINQQNTPPVGPFADDRYLVGASPTGAWLGFANNVAEWDGASWIFTPPVTDYVVYVTSTLTTLRYNGSVWVPYQGTAALLNGNIVSSPMRIGTKSNQLLYLVVNNTNIARFGNANNSIPLPTRFGGAVTTSPNSSAQVEIASTTRGFLAPRMTQAQKNAIVSPATGLLIYQTDAISGFYYYDGASWILISSGGSVNIYNSDGSLSGLRTISLSGNNLVVNGISQALTIRNDSWSLIRKIIVDSTGGYVGGNAEANNNGLITISSNQPSINNFSCLPFVIKPANAINNSFSGVNFRSHNDSFGVAFGVEHINPSFNDFVWWGNNGLSPIELMRLRNTGQLGLNIYPSTAALHVKTLNSGFTDGIIFQNQANTIIWRQQDIGDAYLSSGGLFITTRGIGYDNGLEIKNFAGDRALAVFSNSEMAFGFGTSVTIKGVDNHWEFNNYAQWKELGTANVGTQVYDSNRVRFNTSFWDGAFAQNPRWDILSVQTEGGPNGILRNYLTFRNNNFGDFNRVMISPAGGLLLNASAVSSAPNMMGSVLFGGSLDYIFKIPVGGSSEYGVYLAGGGSISHYHTFDSNNWWNHQYTYSAGLGGVRSQLAGTHVYWRFESNAVNIVDILTAGDVLNYTGDFRTNSSTKGLVVLDRTNGNKYRIYTDGGVVNTELVP